MTMPVGVAWILSALASLLAGRWISLFAPALLAHLEAQWLFEARGDENTVLNRSPSLVKMALRNWCQARSLIPLCRNRKQHLAWEVATLLASLIALYQLGMGVDGWAAVGITWILMTLIKTDLSNFLLPDCLVYPLLWAGLLWRATGHGDAIDGIYGAFFGYAVLWAIAEGYGALRGMKMMGNGDYKLTAALGAWLGWQALPLMILSACAIALVLVVLLTKIRRTSLGNPIPFGPALAMAGWGFLIIPFHG